LNTFEGKEQKKEEKEKKIEERDYSNSHAEN
jgi:hypothetical protein